MGDTRAQAIRITGTGRRTEGTKKGGTPQGGRLESVSLWRVRYRTRRCSRRHVVPYGDAAFRQIEAAGGVTTSVVTLVTALVPDFSTDLGKKPSGFFSRSGWHRSQSVGASR